MLLLVRAELRFFELVHSPSWHRFQVKVQANDTWFILPLPAGDYEVARIQVQEGAL
jgi:hypothetical protein